MAAFTYSSWKWSVNLGWLLSQIMIRQLSPIRFALRIASCLLQEGVKLRVDTWLGRRRTRFFRGIKVSCKKTIRWAKKKNNAPSSQQKYEFDNVVALDAGMKYKSLAQRRLDVAREAFEAAAVELRAAKRGMKDADKYIETLRTQCRKDQKLNNDTFVFVEYACLNNDEDTTATVSASPTKVAPEDDHALVPGYL